MEMSTVDERSSKRGRKRLRNEEGWKRKKRKLQKDEGATYTTYKGIETPGKEIMKVSCSCTHRCSEKLNSDELERIFKSFYKLKNHDVQNKYLFGLIRKIPVHRRTGKGTKNRTLTLSYHVRLSDGKEVQVCKKTYCDVHAIGKKRVEILAKKLVHGDLIAFDQRGKHGNRPHSIPNEIKDKIRVHIASFPRRQSHYSRCDNSKREYLPENLSISRMYALYLQKYEPDVNEHQVKEWIYRKIFNEEFNLSFGYPRSDTCETCDLLNIAIKSSKSDSERGKHQEELVEHHEKAGQGYRGLRVDTDASKKVNTHALITFDLMQNLPVPTLTHGSMFYLRQLWVYNFGIHNTTSSSVSMYMWNESVAGRGADEICSCLQQYIQQLPSKIQRLTCYSDSCFGQNKNFQMICFLNQLTLKRFKQIDHKFLVRGHTYLPNDRDFAQIEKRKGTAIVHVPTDWETVVREACTSKPYSVCSMDSTKFLNFSELTQQYTFRKKDSDKKSVLISKASWMNYGQVNVSGKLKKHPNEVWIRYTYNEDEPWSKVSLLKGRKKLPPSKSISLPIKYLEGHPINPKKLENLQSMLPFLPPDQRGFYLELIANSPQERSDE